MIRLAMLALMVAAPACARAQPIAIVAETGPAATIVIPDDAAKITACEDNPDPRFKARVAFLREGLTHALHCVETAAVMNDGDASQADRHKALLSLVAYRRGVEHLGIANMDRAAGIETDSWKKVPGFAGAWEYLCINFEYGAKPALHAYKERTHHVTPRIPLRTRCGAVPVCYPLLGTGGAGTSQYHLHHGG